MNSCVKCQLQKKRDKREQMKGWEDKLQQGMMATIRRRKSAKVAADGKLQKAASADQHHVGKLNSARSAAAYGGRGGGGQ